ncbi:hypothetical protein CDL15_Pgr000033 [Punica granatum]|uniref:Uncharacterized protein n=1 Tax=Punica granatum TaxID=22663 RepID=A0A218VQG6_PUNGR|nr:hypothetical protein CDL15_Pgr000033 [Punica granatum]
MKPDRSDSFHFYTIFDDPDSDPRKRNFITGKGDMSKQSLTKRQLLCQKKRVGRMGGAKKHF